MDARGAHADTTCVDWVRVEGHAFARESVERLRGSLRLFVHRWELEGVDVR